MSATHLGTAQAHLRAALERIEGAGAATRWPNWLLDVALSVQRAADEVARVDADDCAAWLEREHCQHRNCDRAVVAVLDGDGWCELHRPAPDACAVCAEPADVLDDGAVPYCARCHEREADRERQREEESRGYRCDASAASDREVMP